MRKQTMIGIGLLVLLFLSGCAMNDTIEKVGSRESLPVLRWLDDDPTHKTRMDIMDAETIEEVNDFFSQIDWEEDARDERPTPNYQIGNYHIWLADQSHIVHAVHVEKEKYAELTAEESEFVITFIAQKLY